MKGKAITATSKVQHLISILTIESNPTFCWTCKFTNIYDMTIINYLWPLNLAFQLTP